MKWESVVGVIFSLIIILIAAKVMLWLFGAFMGALFIFTLGFAAGWYLRGKERKSVH